MKRASDQDELNARAFRYLADICGAVASDGALPTAVPIDPGSILAIVQRHRISTRAMAALADAVRPQDAAVADRLSVRANRRRLGALRKAERTATISAALTAAGIRHLGIKGPVLAQQIYGDIAARDSKDLDFFVDPATIAQTTAILCALGFADVSAHDEAGDRFANKHRTFAGDGLEIEVHTRLLDVDALLPLSFETVWARQETMTIGAVAVPALAMSDTLLYLCAHGAQHLWFRLKWLEDIARIATVFDSTVVNDAMRSARETGAEAIVVSALHLVEDVFGIQSTMPIPATRASRSIARLSRDALAAPAAYASAPPLGWILRKLPVQFGMGRNWRYRGDLVRLLVMAPRDFDAALPRGLGWLRLPLRPAMLLRDRWIAR